MAAEEDRATFSFDLDATGLETSGKSAAAVLEDLQVKLQGDIAALAAMQKAFRNLKGSANASEASLNSFKDRITVQKAAIANAQAAFVGLGGSFHKAKPPPEVQSAWASFLKQAQGMPGPIGTLASSFEKFKTLVGGGAMAVGILATAAALLALSIAAATATAALVRFGLAAADARRSELIHLEGVTKLRFGYMGLWGGMRDGVTTGSFLQTAIDKVSGSVALGRNEIAGYSEQLYKMGLRGGNLQAALEGMATTAAVQGDAQAQMFAQWAAGMALTGQSVRKFADDVKARIGPLAARQMLSLSAQTKKLRENFDRLFDGVNLEKFAGGVKMVADLFSQATFTGRALKAMITGLMQPLIDGMAFAAPLVKRFFQGLVIGALLMTVALLTLRKWWRQVFGKDSQAGVFLQTEALMLGVAAAGLLAASFVAIGVAIVGLGILALPILKSLVVWLGTAAISGIAAAAPFLLAALAIGAVGIALYQLYKLWEEVDWTSLGTAIWQGVVKGIKSGFQWVKHAMADLANVAWSAFAGKAEIHSPSKLFEKKGGYNLALGVAKGVDSGKPEVRRALVNLAPPEGLADGTAAGARGAAGGAGTAAAGAQVTVHIAQVTLSGGASDMQQQMLQQFQEALEGVGLHLGARLVPQGA